MSLWANYQTAPFFPVPPGTSPAQPPCLIGPPTPASGFINIGTQFSNGAALYAITALTPAIFAASNAGLGQDGLNPMPATQIHVGDTVTITPALGGLTVISTTALAPLIRICG